MMHGRRPRRLLRSLALSAAAIALVAAGCTRTERPGSGGEPATTTVRELAERSAGGTLVVAAEEPTGFNFHTTKDNRLAVKRIVENIFFYAVKVSPDLSYDYVGLAAEPKLVSRDPQIVEWRIRKSARWSDGTPVTTDDIRYFFEEIQKRDRSLATTDNPQGYVHDVADHDGYERITELDVVDDKTFRATFDPPYPDYRGLWTEIPQADHLRQQPGGWDTGLDAHPGPSAGPYIFEEWVPGERIRLVPNPEWGGDVQPTLSELEFRFVDTGRLRDAVRNREVDLVAGDLDPELLELARSLDGFEVDIAFGSAHEQLGFNLGNRFLAERSVRRAIALALDRDALLAAIIEPHAPEAVRLDNRLLVPGQPGYASNHDDYADGDRAAAAKELRDAGYEEDDAGFFAKDGRRLSLRLTTTAGHSLREHQAELIKKQLEKAGIEIRLDHSPADVLFARRLPAGDFDIAAFAWETRPAPLAIARRIYAGDAPSNYGSYESDDFDRLLRESADAFTPEEQARAANNLDRKLWEDLPSIPLYQSAALLAVRSRFVNVTSNPTSETPFWNAETWGRAADAGSAS